LGFGVVAALFLGLGTMDDIGSASERTTRPDDVLTAGGGGGGGGGSDDTARLCDDFLALVFVVALEVVDEVVDEVTGRGGVDADEVVLEGATYGPRNDTSGAMGEMRPEDDAMFERGEKILCTRTPKS